MKLTEINKKYIHKQSFGRFLKVSLTVIIQVGLLNAEAGKLCENHPLSAEKIQEKLRDLNEIWATLKEKAGHRKSKLNDSYVFQKFLSDYRSVLIT